MRLSVIVPVWQDSNALQELLAVLAQQLAPHPLLAEQIEVVVVQTEDTADASSDLFRPPANGPTHTPDLTDPGGFALTRLLAPRGRGRQMDAGAQAARGDWLWFLHVDSKVPVAAFEFLCSQLPPGWGRFDVRLDVDTAAAKLIAAAMNLRSRLTGICTGDQGMFVHRSLLDRVGGVPRQPLMEDVELSRRLRRLCRPLSPRIVLITSARRWVRDGMLRTILGMWVFRLRYWSGADPDVLARDYYRNARVTDDL